MKKTIKITIFTIIAIIAIIAIIKYFPSSWKIWEDEIIQKDSYTTTEKDIGEDCNAFQMLFPEGGDYIFRFALAGPCKDLKKENYIKEYSIYLEKYRNKLINRRGIIIFDKRESNEYDNQLCDSILEVSKKFFKANASIIDNIDIDFKIKIID